MSGSLLDDALAAARAAVPAGELALAFARAYLGAADSDDLAALAPENAAGAALAHLRLAEVRRPGTAVVRVSNPTVATLGWASPHTVVEVVTDDMPFLVDSVTMVLTRRGSDLHVLLHPRIDVRRDADGRLVEVLPAAESRDGAPRVAESYLHVEIDRERDAELDALRAELEHVLDDVRVVVDDWPAMRARAAQLADDVGHRPPRGADPLDVAEASAFLEWLDDDHFTFVGYVDYDLVSRNGEDALHIVTRSELGVVRRRTLSEWSRSFAHMSPDMRRRAQGPFVLNLTKSQARSTLHRDVPLDYVGVKRFDAAGAVIGESRFVGLYTSTAYVQSVREIPVLRRKVASVIDRARLDPLGHDGRALANILETFPRDDLLRVSVDELFDLAMGILQMGERRRVRLFVSRDTFGRFVSCLVYLPRDRYTTAVRVGVLETLRRAFHGTDVDFTVLVTESVLARLRVTVETPDPPEPVDVAAVEAELAAIVRGWTDELRDALVRALGEERGLELYHHYRDAFPAAYQADVGASASIADIDVLESLASDGGLAVRLEDPGEGVVRAKIYRSGSALVLADVLPVLEHLGTTVVDERPYAVLSRAGVPRWIYSFGLRAEAGEPLPDPATRARVADAFLQVWSGALDDDDFNRLVVVAGLDARDVMILRALCKYLRQAGVAFGEPYLARTLVGNPEAARLLVALFVARFDPNGGPDPAARARKVDAISAELDRAIDAVAGLDEDRILRALGELVRATVRTNAYQRDASGTPKAFLALKLDPTALSFLPKPRPRHEIWVFSPRVEGVHLRNGDIARGGIRWSDRREDFRTEILGLMKAQTVKNSVIVPVGAKGGFVVKRPPADPASRADEVVACYRTFIGALLDLTDNRVGQGVAAPADVVRYDGDDPYLVVAADKGTATFSDVANALARERGFWLDDAFASGGSSGYDHKAIGITSRGAWESVRAHFRQVDVDADTAPLTVVGIGDMSGDVFGNGMLRSPHLRLVAAFDHRHVFVDPDPEPEVAFRERRRLFGLVSSSWADYDPAALSEGGGVHPRSAKSAPLSPHARRVLGLALDAPLTPDDVIRAILVAPVDLFWVGGIGTFVKASAETNADVGDRSNDAVRVDASQLRCRVVAEGGNLGLTQRARVEYALAGGHVNTDAIDNSGGVDLSDHEVNIKILLRLATDAGRLARAERDQLLAAMTDEVAALVLADNTAQANALEIALVEAPDLVDVHARLLDSLEHDGHLDRALQALPGAKVLEERRAAGLGLTAPELAVLLAYVKLGLERDLLASTVPDDAALRDDLLAYFPVALREPFGDLVDAHPLRREIVATVVANSVVNRAGITFLFRLGEETGASAPQLCVAHLTAREVFDAASAWQAVDALDLVVPSAVQDGMFLAARRLVERGARWLLRHRDPIDLRAVADELGPGVRAVGARLPELVGRDAARRLAAGAAELAAAGVPADLAARVAAFPWLLQALDVVDVALGRGSAVEDAAVVHFALAERLLLDQLRDRIAALTRLDRWQTAARAALRADFWDSHRALTDAVLATTDAGLPAAARVEVWAAAHAGVVRRYRQVVDDVEAAGEYDLTTLTVVTRELRALTSPDRAR